MELMVWVIAMGLCGGLLGSLTGIVPGLHVNTLALLMLGLAGALEGLLAPNTGPEGAALLLATLLAATALAHTFVNFIPSTFLGAPEGDTALSVLPAHCMLLEGQGYRAVVLSAVGSLGAMVYLLLLLVPLKWLLGSPVELYARAQPFLFQLLLLICLVLVVTEGRLVPYRKVDFKGQTLRVNGRWSRWLGRLSALGLLLLTGVLGVVCWGLRTTSPVGLPSSVLFPIFTGLFGLSTLLLSLGQQAEIPYQELHCPPVPAGETLLSSGLGTLAGASVALMPGLTSGIGTVLAMQLHRLRERLWERVNRPPVISLTAGQDPDMLEDPDYLLGLEFDLKAFLDDDHKKDKMIIPTNVPQKTHLNGDLPEPLEDPVPNKTEPLKPGFSDTERTILTLGAVNTAATLTVLVGLFIILRPRSGTAIAIGQVMEIEPWRASLPPAGLSYLLMGMLTAMIIAYPATYILGRYFAHVFPGLDYPRLVRFIVAGMVLLVLLFTGVLGLLVLLVATALGMVAPLAGLRRSHAMGVLLVPILLVFGGYRM